MTTETNFEHTVQCSTMVWALLLPSVGTSLYFYNANQSSESNGSKNGQNVIPNGISTVEDIMKQLNDANKCEKAAGESVDDGEIVPKFSASMAFAQLKNQIKTSYSNPSVIKWSIWWAIAMCGYLQVTKSQN